MCFYHTCLCVWVGLEVASSPWWPDITHVLAYYLDVNSKNTWLGHNAWSTIKFLVRGHQWMDVNLDSIRKTVVFWASWSSLLCLCFVSASRPPEILWFIYQSLFSLGLWSMLDDICVVVLSFARAVPGTGTCLVTARSLVFASLAQLSRRGAELSQSFVRKRQDRRIKPDGEALMALHVLQVLLSLI